MKEKSKEESFNDPLLLKRNNWGNSPEEKSPEIVPKAKNTGRKQKAGKRKRTDKIAGLSV